MRILNFASANIDYVYAVPHILRPGETLPARSMEIFPGGKGLNQSVAAAKAGGCVYHAGFIGSDGDFLVDILESSGAKLPYLQRVPEKNGHAMIQVNDQGENCIIIFQGTNGLFSEGYIDRVLADFGSGDYVMLQNEINNLPYILEKAAGKGLEVVLNPSPYTDGLRNLDLSRVSWLILNETEAQGFFETEDPMQIRDSLKRWPKLKVVLTLGARGALCITQSDLIRCQAYQVQAVDTTAAGDCFTGFFVAQLARGTDYEAALKLASCASALTVSRKGAAPSIPFLAEVEAAMPSMKAYPAENGKKQLLRQTMEAWLEEDPKHANLEALARKLGYSKSYTGSLIREIFGKSFTQMLHKTRCDGAAKLLRETDLPVKEIAERVGYENESFFRRVFREYCGKNPQAYRKENLS